MGDGDEGRIKLLGFMYIHVILVSGAFNILVLTVFLSGVVELGFVLGCIIPPNYYYIEFMSDVS